MSREFSARYERGDAAGQAAVYTEDGVIFPPGRAAIKGRAAIEDYWRLPAGRRIVSHQSAAQILTRPDAKKPVFARGSDSLLSLS